MTRKGRRLSPEEEKLWQKITDTTNPLEHRSSFEAPTITPVPKEETAPAPRFRFGEKTSVPATDTRIVTPEQPLRMDRKTYTRMKRGRTNPEARLDLHGMTADRAHSALLAFLLRCHADGKRLVLVITGKGKRSEDVAPIPQPIGVLRRQVPHWLEQPPLRQIILQTAPAHQRHGGLGAIYVYLRR